MQRSARELLRSISVAEFHGYLRMMLDRQRDAAEAEEEEDEPVEVDTAAMTDHQVAALFGTRVRG